MSKKIWIAVALMVLLTGAWVTGYHPAGKDPYAIVGESLTTFGNVYKHITRSYVREVNPEEIMVAGIKGMLGQLDPYSSFFQKRQIDQLRIETTGKYGGLGIMIGIKEDIPTVIAPFEGTPAARVGLEAGDQIVKIEGKSTRGESIEDVAQKLRGKPGTQVTITIIREGQPRPLDYTITREIIKLKAISLCDKITPEIGYVRLSRFSESTGEELTQALQKLKDKNIKSLILDLRGNPGGLLTQAVAVADKFLEKGRLIVSTKGRERGQNNDYYSTHDPVIPVDLPLVILVNKASASASEIVAGAIQDWDRGVIVGTPTFGKGSVQTVFPISEGSALKLTTAYYYTPSGRCINIEHTSKEKYKKALGEELQPRKKQFRTHNGRVIYGGGGITPDLKVEAWKLDNLLLELLRRRMFFSFAVHYVAEHPEVDQNFEVDDQMLAMFKDFLKQKHFDYKTPEEVYVDTLKAMFQKKGYDDRIEELLAELESQLETAKEADFQKNRDYIRMAIRREIASRQWGLEAGIRATFPEDTQLHRAIDILKDPVQYAKMIGKRTESKQKL